MADEVARTGSVLFDLALGAHGNFGQARCQKWADSIKEAVDMAEAEFPGMFVHTAWAIEGEGVGVVRTQDDLEKWMAGHRRTEQNGEKNERSEDREDR